jgi:hypothetical protein
MNERKLHEATVHPVEAHWRFEGATRSILLPVITSLAYISTKQMEAVRCSETWLDLYWVKKVSDPRRVLFSLNSFSQKEIHEMPSVWHISAFYLPILCLLLKCLVPFSRKLCKQRRTRRTTDTSMQALETNQPSIQWVPPSTSHRLSPPICLMYCYSLQIKMGF